MWYRTSSFFFFFFFSFLLSLMQGTVSHGMATHTTQKPGAKSPFKWPWDVTRVWPAVRLYTPARSVVRPMFNWNSPTHSPSLDPYRKGSASHLIALCADTSSHCPQGHQSDSFQAVPRQARRVFCTFAPCRFFPARTWTVRGHGNHPTAFRLGRNLFFDEDFGVFLIDMQVLTDCLEETLNVAHFASRIITGKAAHTL